jgi:hypothetical protein
MQKVSSSSVGRKKKPTSSIQNPISLINHGIEEANRALEMS